MISERDPLALLVDYHDHIAAPPVAVADYVHRGRRRVRRNRGLLTAAVTLALAGIVVTASLLDGSAALVDRPQPVAPQPTQSSSIPTVHGPIEPGSYRIPSSAWSVMDFTVTFPEGWTVQDGHIYGSKGSKDNEFGFHAVVVDEIFTDGCAGRKSGFTDFGPSVDDLATALLQQPGPKKSGPVATTLGGYPATRIDLTVPKGFDLSNCNAADIGLQVWYSRNADQYFVLFEDGIASVYILDVDGERQVFLTQHGAATEEDLAELQAVLDSISFEA